MLRKSKKTVTSFPKPIKYTPMKRNIDLGLLLLRVGLSGLMLTHGIAKLTAFIGGDTAVAGDPLGLGTLVTSILVLIGEFIAPVLILIGLRTRLASIPVIITMAVAAFVVHAKDPIENKEMALLYLVGFIAIGLMGAGRFSIDKR